MPIEYDSKPAIRKTTDENGKPQYELIWNVNNAILSVLTEKQFREMITRLQELEAAQGWRNEIYYFPVMRHRVTG